MPLSDKEILAARECGDIIIDPFDERCLGSDSYDVRLGCYHYRECEIEGDYNLFSAGDAHSVWSEGIPVTAAQAFQKRRVWPAGWKQDDLLIRLRPGETILAHTQEFIGARHTYTTKMFARSSAGRSMIGVCKCAGKGDVGYFNRWTMEITSFSRFHTIHLKVGMRIAQIEFLHVGETGQHYGATADKQKYQISSDLDIVKASWRPEMMLPRFHDDWELKDGNG